MNTGTFDVKWLARGLEDKHLSLSKPFRDFIMECLCRHRLGDSGVFDAIAEVCQWDDNAVAQNCVAAELELPLAYYRSYWEIPPELIDNRPYMFLSFTTCIGQYTEFSITGMFYDEYKQYLDVLAKRRRNT